MEEWAGYVLLVCGSTCLLLARYGHFPDALYPIPDFAWLIGLVAVVTGIGAIIDSRRDKPK